MTQPTNPQPIGQGPYFSPPPSGYSYHPESSPYGTPEKFVGMAWAAVILGIVGVVFSWIPFLDVLTMLGAITGLILGVIAVFGSRKTTAGIGVGLCILATVFTSLVMNRVTDALHPASGSSSASSASGLGYPTPPVAPPLPIGPVTTFDQGTFVVGQDIKPGTYKTAGATPGWMRYCYWARLSGTDGTLDSIIASDGGQGPATVTISSGDAAFKTTGCQTWQKVG